MVNAQPTLWETILPQACLGLPDELAAVDRLLDDAVFFEPYRGHFHATLGRPSVPIETYLRLMVPQVPLPARVRAAVPGGGRLDQLATLRAHPAGLAGAAPHDVAEDHDPLRTGCGGWAE